MAWPKTPLRIRTELLIGGTWVDISAHVLNRQTVQVSWGRTDWSSQVSHSKCPLAINNRDGRYSDDNPHSPYYGLLGQNTPIRQTVTTPAGLEVYRFHMEVPEWPQRWDLSGRDVYVPIECAGILRRLGQGAKPLRDSLRRHIDRGRPLAYWPLTDGEDARHGTEIIQGSQPMRAIGEAGSFYQGQPNWGKGSLAPWLEPVVELPQETIGLITAYVPPRTVTAWSVDHVLSSPGPGNVTQLNVFDNGARSSTVPQVEWDVVEWGSGGFNEVQLRIVERLEDSSSTALLATVSNPGIYDGGAHHVRLTVAANGSGLAWTLYIDGVSVASGTRATGFQPVGRITYRWGTVEGGGVKTSPVGLGHLTYWDQNAPAAAATWRAVQGHVRELAGRRIERLCAEHGVTLQVHGNLDHTPPMGPQRPARFLDALDAAATVDGGVVHEARNQFALAYRTRRSKYNQGI
ncbi:hypothetical protein DMA15_17660 [Streptomyces sp. WAC 01529]|uniref:hypothetical protein n=1 Tax=Streptomyces sp. WAC 01529 TaxID=2203205 RepID=UPI000F6C60B2|nr:hypothetical protein [Streptomyces sp. WAC 01529]AZM54171.1 hypothetical protein DMA15_17660 [Streptomyces sp. WAC 01529]